MGKILVVEDEAELRQAIGEIIGRGLSCTIESAGTIKDASLLLRNNKFDLIICDFQLAGETGADFLRLVTNEHIKLPFLFFTSHNIEVSDFQNLDFPFFVIRKPYLDDLLKNVSEILAWPINVERKL
jgi:CheY-like chemotaxis protein